MYGVIPSATCAVLCIYIATQESSVLAMLWVIAAVVWTCNALLAWQSAVE